MTLGEIRRNRSVLLEALEQMDRAVQHWTRERLPTSWAIVQSSIGFTHGLIGFFAPDLVIDFLPSTTVLPH